MSLIVGPLATKQEQDQNADVNEHQLARHLFEAWVKTSGPQRALNWDGTHQEVRDAWARVAKTALDRVGAENAELNELLRKLTHVSESLRDQRDALRAQIAGTSPERPPTAQAIVGGQCACGQLTEWACSDCAITLGKTTYVCGRACADKHDLTAHKRRST